MKIRTYELILDKKSKQSSLRETDCFEYPENSFQEPEAVYQLMTKIFQLDIKADEYVYMLAFNNKMRLLGIFEVSHGTGDMSLLDPRGVFMRALHIGASCIILVHNHVSGQVQPSKEDFNISKRIRESGELLGIPLTDHIITGENSYYSFKKENPF